MEQNLMTIIAFAAGLLAIVISTYGAIITARINAWSKAKLAEHGLTEAAKWQADLKAGLLTGAKAALLEGKSIPDAIKAAISHTLASNTDAAAGLKPPADVLEQLAKAAVADAVTSAIAKPDGWGAPHFPIEVPRNVDPHFGVHVPAFSIPQPPYRAADVPNPVRAGDPPGSIGSGSLSANK